MRVISPGKVWAAAPMPVVATSVGAASAFDSRVNKTSMYEGAANSCTLISADHHMKSKKTP
uniref:Uncharacterized protein n=1 Tax=Oryza sativa subsp. japonica TaxID=39947 RepID=Q84YM1_ORYSJ|nr:hypothetical protein [Oryza sativa Japonica Group]